MPARQLLFGGAKPWPAFHAVNDTVRGGASTSAWSVDPHDNIATFSGHLDYTKLGGAGFASQATTFSSSSDDSDSIQDWSSADAIELTLSFHSFAPSEPSVFTLSLKDQQSIDRGDGRNASRPTFEWHFDGRRYQLALGIPAVKEEEEKGRRRQTVRLSANWNVFKRTYRGREEPGPPLETTQIRELSFFCRSNFGQQGGDFSLDIVAVHLIRRNLVERAWSFLTAKLYALIRLVRRDPYIKL